MGGLLTFYVASIVLVVLAVPCLFFLVAGTGVFTLVGCAIGLSVAILVYSRLLGRLANLARLTRVGSKKKRKERPGRRPHGTAVVDPWDVPDAAEEEVAARSAGFVQPSRMPALDTPDEEAATGYDVKFDAAPPAAADPEPDGEWEDTVTVEAGRADADAADHRRRREAAAAIKPDAVEESRLRRKRERRPERQVLDGLGGFLFTGPGAVRWAAIAAGIGLLGLLARGLIAFWPMG
jgi:hypothetical protein